MPQITRNSLMTLEDYARDRNAFRARVIEHKKARKVHLGEHVTLLFEDELTMRYQVQEMLRIERIFEDGDIAAELGAYNPLVPDGGNLKATMLIEYPDEDQRRHWLARLKGIEDRVWVRVGDLPAAFAIADEDLERENEDKTSAVHFLRFELAKDMREALKSGAPLSVGVDHPQYSAAVAAAPETRMSLAADLA